MGDPDLDLAYFEGLDLNLDLFWGLRAWIRAYFGGSDLDFRPFWAYLEGQAWILATFGPFEGILAYFWAYFRKSGLGGGSGLNLDIYWVVRPGFGLILSTAYCLQ